jgi:tetratricopeptide (TPR) repeat protein
MRLRLHDPHNHMDIVRSLDDLATSMLRLDMLESSKNCLEAAIRMLDAMSTARPSSESSNSSDLAGVVDSVFKNAGLVYLKMGDFANAIRLLARAIQMYESSSSSSNDYATDLLESCELIASAYEKSGQIEAAEKFKLKALELKATCQTR